MSIFGPGKSRESEEVRELEGAEERVRHKLSELEREQRKLGKRYRGRCVISVGHGDDLWIALMNIRFWGFDYLMSY